MTTLASGGNVWNPFNYETTILRWKVPNIALSVLGVAAWAVFLILTVKSHEGDFYRDNTIAGSGILNVNYDGPAFGLFVLFAIVSFSIVSIALAYWSRIYNAKSQQPVGTINHFQIKFGIVSLLLMAVMTTVGLHFAAEHPAASKPKLVSAIQSWGEEQGLDISDSEATKLAGYSWNKNINSVYNSTLVKQTIVVDSKEVNVYAKTPNRGILILEIFKEKND